ncbi:MAG: hypothetical protein ACXVKA_05565 [Acidimicrobiia bacterium]
MNGKALAIAITALALVTAGCSSTKSTTTSSLPGTCRTARDGFHKWFDASETAESAALHAHQQWSNADSSNNNFSSLARGDALAAAIAAYNADIQTAKTLQAQADQDLAAFTAALKRCDPLGMPKACQGEFAQYQPIIDNAAARVQARAAIEAAIATTQQPGTRQSLRAYNAAVDAHNAALAQLQDLTNTWNVTLQPALNTGITACNSAT